MGRGPGRPSHRERLGSPLHEGGAISSATTLTAGAAAIPIPNSRFPIDMYHEHAGWHSPSLNRHMHLQVFGHAGARVIVFPTTMGTHSEWPDRRMHLVLREHLDNGWIQLYCIDQVHDERWYSKLLHTGTMAWRE